MKDKSLTRSMLKKAKEDIKAFEERVGSRPSAIERGGVTPIRYLTVKLMERSENKAIEAERKTLLRRVQKLEKSLQGDKPKYPRPVRK